MAEGEKKRAIFMFFECTQFCSADQIVQNHCFARTWFAKLKEKDERGGKLMKKMLAKAHDTLREYWKRTFTHSGNRNMSRGAQYVDKIITFPHGDNWRRPNARKRGLKKK